VPPYSLLAGKIQGILAHFARWEQSDGAEYLNNNNYLLRKFLAPSNREISGLIMN